MLPEGKAAGEEGFLHVFAEFTISNHSFTEIPKS